MKKWLDFIIMLIMRIVIGTLLSMFVIKLTGWNLAQHSVLGNYFRFFPYTALLFNYNAAYEYYLRKHYAWAYTADQQIK